MLSLQGSQKSTAVGHEFEILPMEEFWERLVLLLGSLLFVCTMLRVCIALDHDSVLG